MAARRKEIAQVGGGDENVLAGPGFREMPECSMPLESAAAKEQYGKFCRILFDSGRLTITRHAAASTYAYIFDQIQLAKEKKLKPRASWMTQMMVQMRAMDLDGLDTAVAAPAEAPINKFARRGLPNRIR